MLDTPVGLAVAAVTLAGILAVVWGVFNDTNRKRTIETQTELLATLDKRLVDETRLRLQAEAREATMTDDFADRIARAFAPAISVEVGKALAEVAPGIAADITRAVRAEMAKDRRRRT